MSVAESVKQIKAIVDGLNLGWPTYIGSPAAQGDLPPRYIAVCYGGDDRPGVSGVADYKASPANAQGGDRFTVWCTASVASGDVNPIARLDEIEDVYDSFEDALMANRTLNGLLVAGGQATLSTHEWTVEDDGTVATVFWQVLVDVRW